MNKSDRRAWSAALPLGKAGTVWGRFACLESLSGDKEISQPIQAIRIFT
jgi:hypothetical protein